MGKSQTHGGYRERKVFVMFVLLLLARKSAEENRNIGGREWTCVATYKRTRERFCWFIYILVFTASQLVRVEGRRKC